MTCARLYSRCAATSTLATGIGDPGERLEQARTKAQQIDRLVTGLFDYNIIDNALRHTPLGGTVRVACGEDTDNTFVRVVDDGPGIPPDILPSVFEPAVRAESARNSYPDGAGLGLTIAARLLRNQGGTIDAANAPPRGAILTLRLPRDVA
jgi:K+-sensing histidine kinase KdpD